MADSNPLGKAVGFEQPTQNVAWNTRDALLYAVGIGAKAEDFPINYELDPNFGLFPTYPVVLSFKGESQDVVNFADNFKGDGPAPPGLPKFDPNRVVHGSQYIEILKPLPKEAKGWQLKKRIVGVHENKTGIIVDAESVLVDQSGTPYAKMLSSSFNIGAKTSGPFSKALVRAPAGQKPPAREPDWTIEDATTPEQAIVYRLSGDYNPLHIDPRIGKAAGFGGVILHGLATFGTAARGIVKVVGGADPNSLKAFGVRFTSPVKPGDALVTKIWQVSPDEITFVTVNKATGKPVLGGGYAKVQFAKGTSKL